MAITKSSLEATADEFKEDENGHRQALMDAGLKLVEARQVMGAVVKTAQCATAAPTPLSGKGGSRGASSGMGPFVKRESSRGSEGQVQIRGGVEMHGMGRSQGHQL